MYPKNKIVLLVAVIGLSVGLIIFLAVRVNPPQTNLPAGSVHFSIESADALVAEEKYDQAIETLNAFINQSTDKAETLEVKNRLAEVYMAKGDYNRAYDTYLEVKEAESKPNLATLMGGASAATAIGDYKLAKDYYAQAKLLINKSNLVNKEEVLNNIKDVTKELENTAEGRTEIYEANVLMRRGEVAEVINDKEAAATYYNRALELIEKVIPEKEEGVDVVSNNLEVVAEELIAKVASLREN
ncbi:MAG: hypothetical protein WDZ81_01375 [Candidatus Saccharimonadales bacterium]